jgi:hypothetical protein
MAQKLPEEVGEDRIESPQGEACLILAYLFLSREIEEEHLASTIMGITMISHSPCLDCAHRNKMSLLSDQSLDVVQQLSV